MMRTHVVQRTGGVGDVGSLHDADKKRWVVIV
jgi:hypothetical protein